MGLWSGWALTLSVFHFLPVLVGLGLDSQHLSFHLSFPSSIPSLPPLLFLNQQLVISFQEV